MCIGSSAFCVLVVGVGGVPVLATIYGFDSEPVHQYFVWSLSATQSQTRVAHGQEHWCWSTIDYDTLQKKKHAWGAATCFCLAADHLPVALNAIVSWLLRLSQVLMYLNVGKYCVLLNFHRCKFSWMILLCEKNFIWAVFTLGMAALSRPMPA